MRPLLTTAIKVLYEDDQYLVFDKPAGMLVIPTAKNETRTLVRLVNEQFASNSHGAKLHPCHRIDRDTSGAVLFAKGKRNQQLMMDQFKRRVVTKTYVAFVHGRLKQARGLFNWPVKSLDRKRFARRSPALSAITEYCVTAAKKQFSVIEAKPVTGRTNQIRIHFAQAGNPLVGERKYAFARDYPLKFRRIALHSAGLIWIHPITKSKTDVRSPLPADMDRFLKNN